MNFGGRRHLVGDNLQEDDLRWEKTFGGRQPLSGVQKIVSTILGSRDIRKSKWDIRFLKNGYLTI